MAFALVGQPQLLTLPVQVEQIVVGANQQMSPVRVETHELDFGLDEGGQVGGVDGAVLVDPLQGFVGQQQADMLIGGRQMGDWMRRRMLNSLHIKYRILQRL